MADTQGSLSAAVSVAASNELLCEEPVRALDAAPAGRTWNGAPIEDRLHGRTKPVSRPFVLPDGFFAFGDGLSAGPGR